MIDFGKAKPGLNPQAHSPQPSDRDVDTVVSVHQYYNVAEGGKPLPYHIGTLQATTLGEQDPQAEVWIDAVEDGYAVTVHAAGEVEEILRHRVLPIVELGARLLVYANFIYDVAELAATQAASELRGDTEQAVAALQMVSNCVLGIHSGMGDQLAKILVRAGKQVPGATVIRSTVEKGETVEEATERALRELKERLTKLFGGRLDA